MTTLTTQHPANERAATIPGAGLLRVCSYEDRPQAMDSLILMGESFCRADKQVSLHLTVPDAPNALIAWAEQRPQVLLSTTRPDSVSGWDVKPWLLLQELEAGWPEALWLDADVIVTKPLSSLVEEFPAGSLIVAEEWNRSEAIPIAHLWGLASARPVRPINSCCIRATQAHRQLLQRWLRMTGDARYRAAQILPFERRPWHLASDQVLLTALLSSEEFGRVSVAYIQIGRHIAQCAGAAGYRPHHRIADLFQGLPPLIHCIGRKPWESIPNERGITRFLLDFATDVSPYVLASRATAKEIGLTPSWLQAHTTLGSLVRVLCGGHPALAGLPLSVLHACHLAIANLMGRGMKHPGQLD